MVKVTIGALVLCHLIAGPATESNEEPRIVKVLGKITEINTEKIPYFYEDKEKRIAYRVMGDELVIKTDKGGFYFVNANACLLVQDSSMKEVNEVFGKEKAILSTPTLEDEKNSLPFEVQNKPSPEAVTEKIADKVHKTLIAPPPPDLEKKEKPVPQKIDPPKEEPKKEIEVQAVPQKEDDSKKGLFDYIKE